MIAWLFRLLFGLKKPLDVERIAREFVAEQEQKIAEENEICAERYECGLLAESDAVK